MDNNSIRLQNYIFWGLIFVNFLPCFAGAGMNIQSQAPVAGLQFTFIETANTDYLFGKQREVGSSFINMQYNFVDHPLIETFPDGDKRELISSLHSFEIRPGILLRENLEFSFHISMNSIKTPDGQSDTGFADSTLQLKYRITNKDTPIQFAIIPEVYLPTGNEDMYLSSGEIGGSIKVAAEKEFDWFRLAANVGYRYLPGTKWRSMDYRNQMILGLGAQIPLTEQIAINIEAAGFPSIPTKKKNSPGEYYLGTSWAFSSMSLLTAGVSVPGFESDRKSNEGMRAILGFKLYSKDNPIVKMEARPLQCTNKVMPFTYFSRPLNEKEYEVLTELPYIPDLKIYSNGKLRQIHTLKFGEMTGLSPNGIPYVEDGQIAFAIDLPTLPEHEKVVEINQAHVKMTVNKISKDTFLGTEILCLVNQKICSGEVITQPLWADVINEKFYFKNKKAANSFFASQYLKRKVGSMNGNPIYSSALTLKLEDVIKNSDYNVEDIIYPRTAYNERHGEKTLYIVVADDTFVHNDARLELLITIEVCE